MPPTSVRVTKRAIDVLASLVGLGITLPLFPLLALAIRLDSPGPVFYKQKRACTLQRAGGGIPETTTFWILKFRTMRTDAEKGTGAVVASKNDPRVTRLGRLMRRTRIDELPQFINILR